MAAVLPVRMVEKPWGRDCLPAPFAAPAGKRIGEIWFEPPAELPQVLVKYLFTSENLSVQVHPADHGSDCGKEECWLVIDAEPGARLGVGFREPVDGDGLRRAALDGSIEGLMAWHPVRRGDFLHIPPGTVHAIGAGVSLIEIQQNSDVTYRLYDYGRGRELHLDEGLAVADGNAHAAGLRFRVAEGVPATLVEGAHFRVDRLVGPPASEVLERYRGGPLLVIPCTGPVAVDGDTIQPGQCALAAAIGGVIVPEAGHVLIAQPCTS